MRRSKPSPQNFTAEQLAKDLGLEPIRRYARFDANGHQVSGHYNNKSIAALDCKSGETVREI